MIRLFLAIACTLFVAHTACASDGDAILGKWLTEERDATIEIFKCADNYCGRIVWIKEPNYPPDDEAQRCGQPRLDDNNPAKELRKRPIVGLQIMKDFHFRGQNLWGGGTLYDPESGNTYSGKITLITPNTLHLRGFVILSLFGRTEIWTRFGY